MPTISYITIVITSIVCMFVFQCKSWTMLRTFFLDLNAYYVHNKISVKHASMALDIKILSSNKTFTYHIASRHANKNVVLPTLTLVFEISGLSLFHIWICLGIFI